MDKRLYNIWACMRQRCNNPKNTAARWYHDRGIRVCNEWDNSYKSFESWAINNGYAENLTIDRVNPDGNYCPENCRWITLAENRGRARRTGPRKSWDVPKKPKEKKPKEKKPKEKKPKVRVGRFMVVRTSKYNAYYYSVATVIKTGLTKPEARKYAHELSEKVPYNFSFLVYVTDGHKEGDKEFEKNLRYFISSPKN